MKVFLLTFLLISCINAQVISPTNGTTWKVGQKAYVKVAEGESEETVNIFFNSDRTEPLAGGPISGSEKTFHLTVPLRALSPHHGTSPLLVVHRIHENLTSVDNIPIHVIW